MNLKLLLTVALSTAALAAHADVQLYGSIKSGIETSQTRFGGQTYSRTAVADQGSHIGLLSIKSDKITLQPLVPNLTTLK